jgi:microcystin-dependent protein
LYDKTLTNQRKIMSESFLGEIRIVAFNFAPRNWSFCNGAILSIAQNTALFALLGTTYGGNGTTTFALPNLQGRIPIHLSALFTLGSTGGEATHTLISSEMPIHRHSAGASSNAPNQPGPGGDFWAGGTGTAPYAASTNNSMANQALTLAGGGQPHENMPPFLTVGFVIALAGVFPSRN